MMTNYHIFKQLWKTSMISKAQLKSTPAGQAVGCKRVAGVTAGSAWTREMQGGPGWNRCMHGWGLDSGVVRTDPVAPPGVLLMALPPRS